MHQYSLLFNAFPGCDVVSAFHRKGKKTARDTWTACDELTDAFALINDEFCTDR